MLKITVENQLKNFHLSNIYADNAKQAASSTQDCMAPMQLQGCVMHAMGPGDYCPLWECIQPVIDGYSVESDNSAYRPTM